MNEPLIGSFKWMKSLNRSLILNTIRTHGEVSRAEIAKITKLTPPTVTNIVSELLDNKLVIESDLGAATGGRSGVDWPALRQTVCDVWRAFLTAPGEFADVPGVARAVAVIDLLDETVDLTPVRHVRTAPVAATPAGNGVPAAPSPAPAPSPVLSGLLGSISLDQPLREARDAFERIYFEYHLGRESHSMTRVSEKTGLERTHLYRKLKQLGIESARKRGS